MSLMFWQILGILGIIVLTFNVLNVIASFIQAKRRRKLDDEKEWITSMFGNELHVIPQHDLMLHLANGCACSPRRYPVGLPDGTVKWQVVHNALDGRDL